MRGCSVSSWQPNRLDSGERMSGGPAAIRGYLVQTLVALLEALDDADWISVTLEPDHVSEKIDILWQYPSKTKAVQVKSSENQIPVPDAKRWAEEFRVAHADAHELELVLVGPCSQAVIELGHVDRVVVRRPMNLDLDGFVERAAHRLHRFLGVQGLPRGDADYHEMLAGALVEKMARLSAKRHEFTRTELIDLLKRWMTQETPIFPIFDYPPKNPWFTGRDDEIHTLRERLCQTGKAAIGQAISGLGGIGKTQTAIEYGHRHGSQYDAVFWINAASELDLQTGFGKVAKLLRLPHDANDPDSVLAVVKRWLEGVNGHSWLLVYDNADDPPLLKRYLPGKVPNGHILVTSRMARLDVLGICTPLSIEKLPVEDSVQFLLNRADRALSDETERQAARELAVELDGLPLALEQAAAYVAAMRVTYAQYLENYRTRKLGLLERLGPVAGPYPATVATTWLINFEQVEAASNAAADLLRLSAMLDPNEIPFELLTEGARELGQPLCDAVKPSDPLAICEVLEPLTRFSLVGIDAECRTYSIHRLVQEVIKDAMGDEGRRAWAERAVRAINAAIPSVGVSNWSACERLVPQAMAGSRLTEEFGLQSEAAVRLLNKAGHYLYARGQFRLSELLCRQALKIGSNPQSVGDLPFAAALSNVAALCRATGRYEEAQRLYIQALKIDRQMMGEQSLSFATDLNNLALLYDSMGRYAEAEWLYGRALDTRRQVLGEQHPDFATSLNNLAALYRATGRCEEAEPLHRRALEIRRQVLGEQHPDFATSLNNLASLYDSMGRYKEAEPLFQQAMEIRRQVLGEQHPQFAISLNNLAFLYREMGRYEEAEPLYRQALAILLTVLGLQHPTTKAIQANYDALRRKLESNRHKD
jgi:tetratricopeptide (TPR) repeat protein